MLILYSECFCVQRPPIVLRKDHFQHLRIKTYLRSVMNNNRLNANDIKQRGDLTSRINYESIQEYSEARF